MDTCHVVVPVLDWERSLNADESERLPRIAITMGDPAGIGPEVCLKYLNEVAGGSRNAVARESSCIPIVLGDARVLERVADVLGLEFRFPLVKASEPTGHLALIDQPTVVDFETPGVATIEPGKVQPDGGAASFRYIEYAIQAAMAGDVEAVTTGPINKEALDAAGIHYPGHTEILAEKTGTDRWCMMLTSEQLTCSFVTTHVGYRDVPGLLSADRIFDVIQLSAEALERIRGRRPRLMVCGLNPHGGENGLFGNREEERIIQPAVDRARQIGIDVQGPFPPDTVFLPARRKQMDCFVCMYHDQGHIPLKALAFDIAVNTTLGLPIIRTSVDHGTAFDIAWQGKAEVTSLVQAVDLAVRQSRSILARPTST